MPWRSPPSHCGHAMDGVCWWPHTFHTDGCDWRIWLSPQEKPQPLLRGCGIENIHLETQGHQPPLILLPHMEWNDCPGEVGCTGGFCQKKKKLHEIRIFLKCWHNTVASRKMTEGNDVSLTEVIKSILMWAPTMMTQNQIGLRIESTWGAFLRSGCWLR